MVKFPLAAENAYFILAPRWSDLDVLWQIGLHVLLFFVPLLAILILCRYELRLVSRGAACGLLALRVLIVVVLWAAVALQPHVAHVNVTETKARIRIAVDVSASMNVADTQRTAEERQALARTFASADVDKLTRRQIVERILAPTGLDLIRRLEARHHVEIVAFDRTAREATAERLLDGKALGEHEAASEGTDLLPPLEGIATTADVPHLGVLLFSDGKHNAGEPPYVRARGLREMGVPIYPVVIGSREPPRDLMIVSVPDPIKTFKGSAVTLKVECKVANMPAQPMTVEVQVGDKKVLPEHRVVIQHAGPDRTYPIAIPLKLDDVGAHRLTFRAISKDGKEITLANNQALSAIRIIDDRAKVLLVDSDARWEYHYLATALARDKNVTLDRVLFSQPRIGALKDDQLEKAGLAKSKLPEVTKERPDYDPLSAYDCIFLGDVSPEQLPLADRKRIERFVAHRGGTLVLSAGKRFLPMEFIKADTKSDDPLVKLLPLRAPRVLADEKGFTLEPTAAGKTQPFMTLDPDTPETPWPELPKHFWAIAGVPKPAAVSLAQPRFEKSDNAPKLDKDTGIVFQQKYGFGRVLFVGIDSTWRWRFRVGDAYHHRFWGQIVRGSAVEDLLPAGNRWVRFGPIEPVYKEGSDVQLAARINDQLPPLKDPASARMRLHRRRDDGSELALPPVQLALHKQNPNMLIAVAVGPAQGSYRVEIDIPEYRDKIAEKTGEPERMGKHGDRFDVLPRENRELLDLSSDWNLMRKLADESDGTLYTPDTIEEIVDRLERRVERKVESTKSVPWEGEHVWWLLGTLLGLLTLEWLWRRWLDLP